MKLLKTLGIASAALMLFPAANAFAQTTPEDTTSLLAAEDALFQAEIAHDTTAVAAGLADDLSFVHANGRIETKADFVGSIASGKAAYVSIQTKNREARVWGDVGVTRGQSDKIYGNMALSDLYLAVYVRHDGHWQLLDWQTSPLAPPKPITAPTK